MWVMNADGSGKTQLTKAENFSENPNWSPNGQRIVFDSDRVEAGNLEIYSMRADGSDVQQLTDPPALDALPAYSPDGKKIVFASDRAQKDSRKLFVMGASGGEPTRLVTASGYSYHMVPDCGVDPDRARGSWALAWSPDGRSIALTGALTEKRSGTSLVRPDGSGFHRISTYGNSITQRPSWSPDSRSLAVLDRWTPGSDRQTVNEIWAIDARGRGAWRLTQAWRYGWEAWSTQWNPKRLTTAQLAGTAALLQGRDLVLQTLAGIDVIDADKDALLRHWALPFADARLADLQDGIALLTAGTDVHLLRLADGATSIIHTNSTTPVLAQLEPSGLSYATTSDDPAWPGRVIHIPWNRLPLAG
jgi:Tol biopolymer transport system component